MQPRKWPQQETPRSFTFMQMSMAGQTSPHWLDTHASFIYQMGGWLARLVNIKAGQNIMYHVIYNIWKGRLSIHIVMDNTGHRLVRRSGHDRRLGARSDKHAKRKRGTSIHVADTLFLRSHACNGVVWALRWGIPNRTNNGFKLPQRSCQNPSIAIWGQRVQLFMKTSLSRFTNQCQVFPKQMADMHSIIELHHQRSRHHHHMHSITNGLGWSQPIYGDRPTLATRPTLA